MNAGDRVEVRGMNGRKLCTGEVDRVDGSTVYVTPDGKAKAKPYEAGRVRSLEKKPAPLYAVEPPKAPPAPPKPRAAKMAARAPVLKPRTPLRSKRYLAFVREHPCANCHESWNIEAHHWAPTRGMGQKVCDLFTVALCRRCHRHFHDHGHLPKLDKDATRVLFLRAQNALLAEWIRETGAAA